MLSDSSTGFYSEGVTAGNSTGALPVHFHWRQSPSATGLCAMLAELCLERPGLAASGVQMPGVQMPFYPGCTVKCFVRSSSGLWLLLESS